jgi:hypothetical protein
MYHHYPVRTRILAQVVPTLGHGLALDQEEGYQLHVQNHLQFRNNVMTLLIMMEMD